MTCCHCVAANDVFGTRRARRDLARLRKKGVSKTTRILLDEILARGITGARVLDIGAGVGGIHLELLERGADSAVAVDASAAFQEAAKAEADRRGLSGRVTYMNGDYVDRSSDLGSTEIVCLDRVICCYPDMDALVSLSARQASRLYGVVFPLERPWTRALFALINGAMALTRNPFRIFLHPARAVENRVHAEGLVTVFHRRVGMWQALVFERPAVSQA